LETQAESLDQPSLKELVESLATEMARASDFLDRYAPVPAAKAS